MKADGMFHVQAPLDWPTKVAVDQIALLELKPEPSQYLVRIVSKRAIVTLEACMPDSKWRFGAGLSQSAGLSVQKRSSAVPEESAVAAPAKPEFAGKYVEEVGVERSSVK